MWMVLMSVALAGYGDAVDGHPNRGEREVQVWTNGVRLAPNAFADDYGGDKHNCFDEFLADETEPHLPVAWNAGLANVARLHSLDMQYTEQSGDGGFGSAMSHASSDGTTFGDRVSQYYPTRTLGENVAFGFEEPYAVVMAWMCSAGHRENLMRPTYVELGVGLADPYWTQDFGGRALPTRRLNMGVHIGENPVGTVTLAVDAWNPSEPVMAVLDGVAHRTKLITGEKDSGVYGIDLPIDEACHLYWFASGEERFPEEGAYGFGPCLFDDVVAGWSTSERVHEDLPDADFDGDGKPDNGESGCNQNGGAGATWLALAGLLAIGRRKRA